MSTVGCYRLGIGLFWCLILGLLPLYPVQADLDTFKDRIEGAEANKGEGQTPQSEASGSSGEGDSGFAAFLFKLFGWIWLYNNTNLHYGAYPYCIGGYIQRPPILSSGLLTSEVPQVTEKGKYYWFSTGLSALYLQDMGGGSLVSFSGNGYKFIGPYGDLFLISDGKTLLNGIRAGIHFSLIQSNGFNASLYAQYQIWTGLLFRQGGDFGLEFRLYPVKPLTLRVKVGTQAFEFFSLGEVELEAGLMYKAWEGFAGYRWWTLTEEASLEQSFSWNGPYLGIRRYF
ncbi:MAG: hypothetical protein LBD93_05320 [Treponema sp.]|jgi:hypothetical protein|nr:hypothetical protein [Treponema sp.]